MADVRLLKLVGGDALTRHARATLAAQFVAPRPLGMIFAYPSQAEADATVRINLSEKAL